MCRPYVQCVAGLACPMRPGVGVQCIGVVVGVKIVQCIGTSRYRDKRKHWWQGVVRMWSWYNFRVIKCVVKVVVCPMWLAGPMCCSVGLSNASRRWYDQCISGVVVRIGNGE